MEARYTEFEWNTTSPGNGDSGRGLADRIILTLRDLPTDSTVCDLGCGNGYLAECLAEAGYKVVGVDASSTGIAIARQTRTKATFVQEEINSGIAQRMRLKDFDLVVASDVIEHLYRPADLLEAAASLLKASGRLVVTTPYHGYFKNLALSITGKMDFHFSSLDEGGHIKFFSVKTLSELLLRSGFGDLRFSFYGRAPLLWKNMICLARKVN